MNFIRDWFPQQDNTNATMIKGYLSLNGVYQKVYTEKTSKIPKKEKRKKDDERLLQWSLGAKKTSLKKKKNKFQF